MSRAFYSLSDIAYGSEADDFEVEAQEAANIYAQAQRIEADREKLKVENKARRKAGLPALNLPRKVNTPIVKRAESDNDSFDEPDDSGERLWHLPSDARELRYEGRG